jgi:hypothetical protein
VKLNTFEKFEKLESSTISCQLSRVVGGMLGTTGSATDKSTCSSGVTDDGEADDHDADSEYKS